MIGVRVSLNKNIAFSSLASNFFWVSYVFLIFLISISKYDFLPENFFYDMYTMYEFYGADPDFGSSYGMTAYFFYLLGVREESLFISLFGALLVCFSTLWVVVKSKVKFVSIRVFFGVVFWGVLSAIYLTMPGKDFWVLIIVTSFLVVYFLWGGAAGLLTFIALSLIYSFAVREYWLLVVLIFLSLVFFYYCIGWEWVRRPLGLLVVCSSVIFCVAFSYYFVFGQNIDSFRVLYNEGRFDRGVQASNTMILPWFGSGGFIQSALNSILTFGFFFAPLPLLYLMSPYYLVLFSLISSSFYDFFSGVKSTLSGGFERSFILLIVISFMVVQSVFEPDFGSFVRHLSPFFPLMLYVGLTK